MTVYKEILGMRFQVQVLDAISPLINSGFKVVPHHVEDGAPVVGRARMGKES